VAAAEAPVELILTLEREATDGAWLTVGQSQASHRFWESHWRCVRGLADFSLTVYAGTCRSGSHRVS